VPSTGSNRAAYVLFVANAISMVGNRMALLAIPWFVLATTGSAAKTGITAFFTLVPIIVATLFGGVFVDRFGFKASSIVSDVASGLAVVAIPILYSLDLLSFALLQVLVFLGALLDAPGETARSAMLPEFATETMPIERLAAIRQVVNRGASLLGAPLAGFLIAWVNAENVLYVDAATFAVSAMLIWIGVPDVAPSSKPSEPSEPVSYLADIKTGLSFIGRDRLMVAMLGVVLVLNMLDGALTSVVYPVFVDQLYDSAIGLGLMFGFSGGGAVVGALLYAWIGARFAPRTVFLTGFIGIGVVRLVLLAFPPLWVVVIVSGLVGLAAGPINPVLDAALYKRIPGEIRARVLGAVTSFAMMAMPLGVLGAGFAIEALGLRTTLTIVFGAYLLIGVSLLANRAIHGLDDEVEIEA
jgi:MFS family permease